jgi:hypothetical protein
MDTPLYTVVFGAERDIACEGEKDGMDIGFALLRR